MRFWLQILIINLIALPSVYSQQQYTESACILLQHQVKRFSHDLHSKVYRESKYQLDTYCRNPIPTPLDVANFVPDNQIRTVRPFTPPPAPTLREMLAAEVSSVEAETPLPPMQQPAAAAATSETDITSTLFDSKLKLFTVPLVLLFGFIVLRGLIRRLF